MAGCTSHVAVPAPAFARVLELLASSLDLVAMLGVEGVPLDGARAVTLQAAVTDARAEAAAIARQAVVCGLMTVTAAPPALVH